MRERADAAAHGEYSPSCDLANLSREYFDALYLFRTDEDRPAHSLLPPRAPCERAGAHVHATRARAHQASRKMVFSVRCRNPAAARLIVDLRRDRSAKRTLRARAHRRGSICRRPKCAQGQARAHARTRIRAHAPACEAHVPHVAREVRHRDPMARLAVAPRLRRRPPRAERAAQQPLLRMLF